MPEGQEDRTALELLRQRTALSSLVAVYASPAALLSLEGPTKHPDALVSSPQDSGSEPSLGEGGSQERRDRIEHRS